MGGQSSSSTESVRKPIILVLASAMQVLARVLTRRGAADQQLKQRHAYDEHLCA